MDNSIKLEELFHKAALKIYDDWLIFGYRANRYLQKVRKDRGVKAAKSWLNPKNKEKEPTKGFLILKELGKLSLSLEVLVLQKEWKTLFSPEELEVAKKRLIKHGYNGPEV
jgi:5-methylcytosine-specific restriction enzyme A